MSEEEGKSTSDRRLNNNVMDGPPGSEKTDTVAKRPKSPPSNKRRRSKSRSRSRSFERRRSRSYSPDFRRGGRRRFFRRSRSNDRFRGRFRDRSRERDRFYPRRSRSRSRSRSRGRRFDRRNRRSNSRKSPTPPPPPQYQQQPPAPPLYNDPNYAAYPGYMPTNTYTFDYTNAYPPPAPSFIQQTPAAPNMILPGAPGDEFMGQSWAPMVNVPPPVIPEPQIQETEEEKSKREEAVKKELQTQKEALRTQRDEYLVRSQNLKRELKVLKQKRADLLDTQSGNPPSPRTNSFVKENDKLQSQIINKLNTIMNVIDMLNGLIGNESDKEDIVDKKQMNSNESSPERLKTELLESMNKNKEKKVKTESDDKKRVNYVYYDPELHWCKCCSVFPKTAKDYLNHLQSMEHTQKQGEPETPWRDNLPEPPKHHSDAVTKRTPIRGLQFFVPSPAWYCKLCSFWMGDLASASAHLKSELHSEKYNEFVSGNPSYEVDWMSQRQHAYDYYRENESTIKQDESEEAIDKGKSESKFDQIPLNIGGNNHHPTIVIKAPLELPKKDKEDSKKRKKKKKDEKNKKKKKRSKKRKNRDSSSSSSSDSDSDSSSSDSDKDKSKEANANSIRVAMRKFLGQAGDDPKSEAIGKWTMVPEQKIVPPPPPAISENQIKEKKRDELMIQQWMEPNPILSQGEKKLLEQLKGRLKSQGKEPTKSVTIANKEREKEKSRDREVARDRRGYRRNSPRGRNSVSPSPRDRGRRSRSRSYDRDRNRRHRRYSRSRSRSRSRSKSHSRPRRVEKPMVHFPSEPKLPPLRDRDREDSKKGRTHKREDKDKSTKSSSTSVSKKLPFIGRMPVFKKQHIDKKQEIEPEKPPNVIPQPTPAPQEPADMEVCEEEDMDAQYMPDPLQFSALMGAPPPPPMPEQQKIEEILPPGIDETEHDLIPKPISDAPIPRKGPLPQDFQETLNILFDGDKPKPVPEKKPEVAVSSTVEHSMHMDSDSVHMMTAEDVYSQFSSPFVPAPPAPPSVIPNDAENHHDGNSNLIPGEIPIPDKVPLSIDDDMIEEEEKDEKHNGIDLDELALLGIDANDLCMTSITMK